MKADSDISDDSQLVQDDIFGRSDANIYSNPHLKHSPNSKHLQILTMKLRENSQPLPLSVIDAVKTDLPVMDSLPATSGAVNPPDAMVPVELNNNEYFTQNVMICVLYGLIVLIGIVTNIYVVYRMRCFRNRDREQYRNGIGICLCAMAVSHLVALASLLLNFALLHGPRTLSGGVHQTICKLVLFTTHTAYTQSMWCWLFMSGLRYLATTRPLQYTTLWRLPFTAMSAVLVGSMIENSWLLITHNTNEISSCTQTFDVLDRIHRLFDVCISFVIPTVLVLYMDIVVLCRRRKPKLVDPMLQFVINRPNIEPKRMFYRFFIVTVSILLLNLPENFLRFISIFYESVNTPNGYVFTELCHLMFFSQFAFNAFYLTMHVYDKSVLSKTNSSRQLSISIRQRLEESSHMLRERSSTISYRATTPIPPLARNSSCCALDELCPKKHWL